MRGDEFISIRELVLALNNKAVAARNGIGVRGEAHRKQVQTGQNGKHHMLLWSEQIDLARAERAEKITIRTPDGRWIHGILPEEVEL